jgi:hypothetical protein
MPPQWKVCQLQAGKQRERTGQLCPSEVMTILIHFLQSHYRTFKAYYLEHVQVHLASEFPHLVSYPRFVALIPRMVIPLLAYLQSRDASLHEHQFHRLDLDSASVIPNASVDTASLPRMLDGPCPAWAGSLAVCCTWPRVVEARGFPAV